jgi:N-acetylglutamate synthase-like GNAT family acetyltransferase
MSQARKVSRPEVIIRRAERRDAGDISRLLLEAFGAIRDRYTPEGFADVTPDEERVRQRFDEGALWVAEIDGKVVGTVSLSTEPEGLYVRSMAVSPQFQGQGIGHKLLKALHEYAAGTDEHRIFLYTLPFQLGARELYEKHGYSWVRDTPAEEWFGVPGLEMEKFLDKKNAVTS